MSVRRLPPLLLALVLGLLAALAVACGDSGDEKKLLSPTRASDIKEELDLIAERVEKGECVELDPAFTRLTRAVAGLPGETDRGLRRRLNDGVANLRDVAPRDCRDNRPKTTTTETTPETVPETIPETVPETVPPETTTTPPQTDTGVPPETTPVPPTETDPSFDPGDSGGSEAPESGFAPPGQAKKGDKG